MAVPAALLAPDAIRLASSVTAHVAAALGTPLLQSTTTRTRNTKKGTVVQTTGVSVPAWAVVAGGALFLLSQRPSGTSVIGGLPWWEKIWSPITWFAP